MITAREASPTPNVTGSIFPRLARYTPHLDRNSEGTSVSPESEEIVNLGREYPSMRYRL